MSITYKQLNHDISDIINKANNRKNTIDYIKESRSKIAEYYENNIKDIDIDVLLKMHKKLINDNKVINDNLAAVFFGLLGSLIFKFIEDFELDKNEIESVEINSRFQPAAIFIAFIIIMFAIAFGFSKLLDYFNNNVYNYKSLYIDEWHANYIKAKYLKELFPEACEIESEDMVSDVSENIEKTAINKPQSEEEAFKIMERKYKFLFYFIHRKIFDIRRIFSGFFFFKFKKRICIQKQLLQLNNARNESENLQSGLRETVNKEIDYLQKKITGKNDKENVSNNKTTNTRNK